MRLAKNGDTHKNARFTKDTADKTGMSDVINGLVLHSVVIGAAAAWRIAILVVVPDIIVRQRARETREYRRKVQHAEILLASPLQTNFSSYRRNPP
jgi:hypothetical protein